MEIKTIPTLYEWMGGQQKLETLTDLFYKKVLADELLGPVFGNMSPAHTRHVAHFIGEVFGGPKLYTNGDAGSHAKMVAHHLGKTLTNDMRKRWLGLLLDTADEIGVPDDPEFRSALLGYLEWGSRLAVMNSNTTENPVSNDEPMPQWGWGQVGGPYLPGN
ncbi:MAG: globin [Chitinophagaceae bacterium]|nr:MAG: globin [Chitinophagaceae bacterium]